MHAPHQAFGLFTVRGIVPASCEALVQFILGSLQATLEDGNAI
jgi:hypothetical protein